MAPERQGGSTKGQQKSTVVSPFRSLILATTRPIIHPTLPNNDTKNSSIAQSNTSSGSKNGYGIGQSSYIILLQKTYSLKHRLTAAEPTAVTTTTTASNSRFNRHPNQSKKRNANKSASNNDTSTISERDVYTNAGLIPPKETSQKTLMGDLMTQAAFLEFIDRCNGHVILISCVGSKLDYGSDGRFQKNGVVIDLNSDPLGWDDDDVDENMNQSNTCHSHHQDNGVEARRIIGKSTKLRSIMDSIKMATDIIWNNRHSCPTDTMTSSTHDTRQEDYAVQPQEYDLADNDDNSMRQQHEYGSASFNHNQQEYPIPILFDSISPLLLYHGVDKVMAFIQHLKHLSTIPTCKTSLKSKNDQDSIIHHALASPIFLPVTTEVLAPFQNRSLEDASDAVLSLDQGQLFIAKRSARHGGMVSSNLGSGGTRLMKEVQYFDFDRIRQDINFLTTNSNNKKVPDTSSSQDGDDASNNRNKNIMIKQKDVIASESTFSMTDKSGSSMSRGVEVPSSRGNAVHRSSAASAATVGRRNPILAHENDGDQTRSVPIIESTVEKDIPKAAVKPRIYFEENDPEFDDFDEEDPDDDLDI